jgi:hypothetical protein
MKRLLFLLASLICTFSALAVDPLDGAFGLKFGEVFTPNENNPSGLVRTDDHSRMLAYQFKPAAPNRSFNEYWVYITPATHRIFRIVAVGRANNEDLAVSQQNAVLAVAREKYSGDFSIHDRWVFQGVSSVTVRPPTPQADGSVLWQVAYTNLALSERVLLANNGTFEEVDETGL